MEHKVPLPWKIIVPVIVVCVGLAMLTELYIGTIPVPSCGIGDRLHDWTLWLNRFFHRHVAGANFVLITTSIWFDFCCLFLIYRSIFGHTIRPYMSLFIFIFLRQLLQVIVSLPVPADIIWYYPGIPSFFVRYGVSNDLYFSAHTGVSLLCAFEFLRFKKRWLTSVGFVLFAYMVFTVLVFQIHYTMDVYTAILTVFLSEFLSYRWSPAIDRFLLKFVKIF